MNRLTGKTVLITGGTTGIGFATAKLFISEGARVAITGQDSDRVAQAAQSLGASVIAIRADVSSKQDMLEVGARLESEFGHLDVVFANAGIAKPMTIGDVDDANIDEQVSVNFKGVIYTVQAALPLLANPSSIIITGTTMIDKGIAGMAVYAATKAAVRSLARTLSAELVTRGVRVNTLSPGLVETPIYGKLGLAPTVVQEWATQLLTKVPASRFGQPEEIAKAALYLASDESSYMMGENIMVDGGVSTL